MATRSGRPPHSSAARLQETSGSRSSIPSQAFVVTLAAVAAAAVIINGRFHGNINAEVAPRAQFLRDETIGVGTGVRVHRIAFNFPDFTNRDVSARNELVTRRGRDQRNAFSAGSFTASSSSTNSSSIAAPDFITRGCTATFDKGLISPSSKASQSRTADGGIEKIEGGGGFRLQALCTIGSTRLPLHIEGGGDFRVQCSSCFDVQRPPPHIETAEGKDSREILHAPLQVEEGGGARRPAPRIPYP